MLLADDEEIKSVEELLESKYTVKVVSVIGDGGWWMGGGCLAGGGARYFLNHHSNHLAGSADARRHV